MFIVAPLILSLIDVMIRRSSVVVHLDIGAATNASSSSCRVRGSDKVNCANMNFSLISFSQLSLPSLLRTLRRVNRRSICCSNCKTRREQLPATTELPPLTPSLSGIQRAFALEERINSNCCCFYIHFMDNFNFFLFLNLLDFLPISLKLIARRSLGLTYFVSNLITFVLLRISFV
jgi:hypothetical protein